MRIDAVALFQDGVWDLSILGDLWCAARKNYFWKYQKKRIGRKTPTYKNAIMDHIAESMGKFETARAGKWEVIHTSMGEIKQEEMGIFPYSKLWGVSITQVF